MEAFPGKLTADYLYGADAPPVPLAGHLHPGQLGARQHFGELCVLLAEVLVQVAADAGRDLERPEECEEDAEQDVEAPNHECRHVSGSVICNAGLLVTR